MPDDGPAGMFKPLASAVLELAQMPLALAKDIAPDIQNQIKELPEILRLNGAFFTQNMRMLPDVIQKEMGASGKDASKTVKDINAPLTAIKALSPIPILSPDEIVEQLNKSADKSKKS